MDSTRKEAVETKLDAKTLDPAPCFSRLHPRDLASESELLRVYRVLRTKILRTVVRVLLYMYSISLRERESADAWRQAQPRKG
jgi:hypothetical protein